MNGFAQCVKFCTKLLNIRTQNTFIVSVAEIHFTQIYQNTLTEIKGDRMKKYKVIEVFTVGLISEVEAENEEQAQEKHLERTGQLTTDAYTQETGEGAGDSYYEIEEIK